MSEILPAGSKRPTLRRMMGAIAVLAIVFAVLRPYATPATYRAANRVSKSVGPKLEPGFDPRQYQTESAIMSPSGFWRVHFVRVAGSGPLERDVMVPDQAVRKARWLPW
jgi:hypothetical protein